MSLSPRTRPKSRRRRVNAVFRKCHQISLPKYFTILPLGVLFEWIWGSLWATFGVSSSKIGKYCSRVDDTLFYLISKIFLLKMNVSLRREQYYPTKNASRLDESTHIFFDIALVQARGKLLGQISLSSRREQQYFSRYCSRPGERQTCFENIALV